MICRRKCRNECRRKCRNECRMISRNECPRKCRRKCRNECRKICRMIFSKEMSNDFLEGNVEGFGILFCQKRFVEIKLIYSKKHTQTPYNPMDHHSDGRLDKARSTVFGCINLFILILSNLDHSDRCLLAWSTCKNFVKMSQLTFQRRCRYYGRLFINDFLNSLNRIQWAYHNGCACVWNVFSCVFKLAF